MVTFQDYIDMLRSGKYKPIAKVEWLRVDETVESTIVADILGGSITVNRNNGSRRTCSVNLQGTPDLLPDVYGIWVKKKFKLWMGFIINGEEYFLPQGIFVLTDPNYNSSPSGLDVTITGTDKFSLLNGELGGLLKDIYQISAGINVNNAVRTILTAFGDPKQPIMDISSQTFPYDIRKSQDENIGDMLKEIAEFSARNIFYDEDGYLNFVDDINDEAKGSIWDFNDSLDSFSYLDGSYTSQFTEVRNLVKVIGVNVNGTIPMGTAINELPITGTEVSRIGEIPKVVLNDYISTNTEALNLANYMLKRLCVLGVSGSVGAVKMPHLDVDKIITITDSQLGYNRKRFLIDNISLGLGVDDGATINVVTASEEDFTVGSVV